MERVLGIASMLERNRRWPIAALVFFGHVLLLFLLDESLQEEPRNSIDGRRPMLFFIKTPRLPHPPIESSTDRGASTELSRLKPTVPAVPASEGSASAHMRTPRMDWRHEAAESASNAIQEKQIADALKSSEASKAPAKKCVKPKAPVWRKETPTYGFQGGLPFVRFHDDRCIFVLVFFSCGFGAKPQADSHLFDDMHNYPNDSSVPDLDECEEAR